MPTDTRAYQAGPDKPLRSDARADVQLAAGVHHPNSTFGKLRSSPPLRAIGQSWKSFMRTIFPRVTSSPQTPLPHISEHTSPTQRLPQPRPPQPNEASKVGIPPAAPLHPQDTIFIALARVAVYGAEPGIAHDDCRQAVIMYDTGCEKDLVSTAYMEACRLPQDTTPRRTFAMSITGAAYDSVGEVDIRWYDPNFTRYRYLDATCLVVESNFFDIIIGRRTLEKLQLFVRNPAHVAGPTFAVPTPHVDRETPFQSAPRILC
jgi:hypothetical protein